MNRFFAYGCLALSMALVGSYVALSKPLVAALPVFLLAWLRFGVGGLAILHWLKKPADEAPMNRSTRQLVFLESFLGNFLFSICMLYGVALTGAVAAGVIMASIPAAVAVMSFLFLREQVRRRTWAAVACAVAGISLLSLASSPHAQQEVSNTTAQAQWLGHLLLMGAVLCEAAYAVIGKKLSGVLGPKRITALINVWGFILMTPLGLWVARNFDFGSVTTPTWSLFVFYALAASVWSVWLWMTGLRHVPAHQAGIFTVMLPISATLVGVGVLGEALGPAHIAAFTLALAGVGLATWPDKTVTHMAASKRTG